MFIQEKIHVVNCFGCSQENPIGLKLKCTARDNCVTAEFTPGQYHMGPPGSTHGGIIMSLIDEATSVLARGQLKYDVRTIRSEIVFRNPANIGQKIYAEACLKEEKSRAIIVSARVYSDNKIIAEGTGTLLKINGRQYDMTAGSGDR